MKDSLSKITMLICVLAFYLNGNAQVGELIDQRDGKVYKTIAINETVWMSEDLTYQSPHSYCAGKNAKQKYCSTTNYYPLIDRADACPAGWEIPLLEEWQEYLDFYFPKADLLADTLLKSDISTIMVSLPLKPDFLFEKGNPLGLSATGWIEKGRLKNKSVFHFWINDGEIQDEKYHIHAGNNSYVAHSHEEYVTDVPLKKQRYFAIRCVKKKEQNKP